MFCGLYRLVFLQLCDFRFLMWLVVCLVIVCLLLKVIVLVGQVFMQVGFWLIVIWFEYNVYLYVLWFFLEMCGILNGQLVMQQLQLMQFFFWKLMMLFVYWMIVFGDGQVFRQFGLLQCMQFFFWISYFSLFFLFLYLWNFIIVYDWLFRLGGLLQLLMQLLILLCRLFYFMQVIWQVLQLMYLFILINLVIWLVCVLCVFGEGVVVVEWWMMFSDCSDMVCFLYFFDFDQDVF